MGSNGENRPTGGGRKAAVVGFLTLAILVAVSFGWLWLRPEPGPDAVPAPQRIQDKHYLRKHGPGAYYGQKK